MSKKCEYCGYDGDGFEEGEFGFWCPDCQGFLYKEGKEDYSQTDIILEKPVSDHRPIIQKSKCLYPVKFYLHQELAALITELLREFPGCADILLTYDDQKILHELYDQNHIGIHMIGRKYSCSR